jgi:bacterioferritin (cytochrome b1)
MCASVLTRRQLLGSAGVGGSAALVVACGGGDGAGGATREQLEARDLRLFGSALDLEHTLIAAYTAGAGLLRPEARDHVRAIVAHEREHAKRLAEGIELMGGKPNPPKTPEEYRRAFPALRDEHDVLRFTIDLENAAVRAYSEAMPKLSNPRLRQLAAAIATTEAEHAALLRGDLGRPQVPDAFVTGRSQIG